MRDGSDGIVKHLRRRRVSKSTGRPYDGMQIPVIDLLKSLESAGRVDLQKWRELLRQKLAW